MPGLSGSGYTNSYNSSLGEGETMILEAGIPLFELKPTTLQYYPDKIMGLWAIKVNQRVTAANKVQTTTDWYRKRSAYVTVEVFGKNGKRFAYVPDDPVWHNRVCMLPIVLGARPKYEILRYHTQEGFASGARAIKELVMLRDLTQEFIVYDRDRKVEVFRSFDGVECDNYIAAAKRKDADNEVSVIGGAEVLIKKAQLRKPSDHLELRIVKQPHIQKIIDRVGIDWFTDKEWTSEVLPDIKRQIADRFGEADRKARREQALQYVPELKEQLDAANQQIEQLKPLVELMKDPAFANMLKQYAPAVANASSAGIPPVVTTEPVKEEVSVLNKAALVQEIVVPSAHSVIGESNLEELGADALRRIARESFGITGVTKKSKEALLIEIREKQGIPDEEPSSEADEIDVNDE